MSSRATMINSTRRTPFGPQGFDFANVRFVGPLGGLFYARAGGRAGPPAHPNAPGQRASSASRSGRRGWGVWPESTPRMARGRALRRGGPGARGTPRGAALRGLLAGRLLRPGGGPWRLRSRGFEPTVQSHPQHAGARPLAPGPGRRCALLRSGFVGPGHARFSIRAPSPTHAGRRAGRACEPAARDVLRWPRAGWGQCGAQMAVPRAWASCCGLDDDPSPAASSGHATVDPPSGDRVTGRRASIGVLAGGTR